MAGKLQTAKGGSSKGELGVGGKFAKTGRDTYRDVNRSFGVSEDSEIFGQFAKGNVGKGIVNALYGAPGWEVATDLFRGPKRQILGGSEEALANMRGRYQQGAAQGRDLTGAGVGLVEQATGEAAQNRGMAAGMYGSGAALGGMGVGMQNDAVNRARAAARQNPASVAEAQMMQGLARTQQGMLAQASAARGGNQAAAIRGAQQQGANMALDVNGQAGLLRRQEATDRIGRQMAAEQMAAGVGGQQMGQGFTTMGQGAGYALQGTGQVGTLGMGLGNMGLGQQQLYTGAELDANKAQLEYDARLAGADAQRKAGIMSSVGGGIMSMFGG